MRPAVDAATGAGPSPAAYGLAPGPGGYRLADLQCGPGRAGWRAEGVYSESAVAIVASGVFDYRSEGRAGTAVPGAFLFANKAAPFACRHLCADGNRRQVLFLSAALLEAVAEDLGLDAARFPDSAAPPSPRTPVLAGLMHRIARHGADSDEAAAAVAEAALRGACRSDVGQAVPPDERRRIVAAVRYVNDRFAEPCTLDALAAVAGMARFRFARRFRAVTGETANQYVLNRRLSAAAAALLASKRPVAGIARAVGFNDLSYFYARFRAAFGRPPADWRRLNGGQDG